MAAWTKKRNSLTEYPVNSNTWQRRQLRRSNAFSRRGGGRPKQAELVALTGWSPAKVSRVLSEMEVQDRIIRIKVGREKVVCIPTAVPEPLRDSHEGSEY